MAADRIITSGISDIWRNRKQWLHLGKARNPVLEAGSVKKAASHTKVQSEKLLYKTRLQIMIYEAQPDVYESFDDIKI
jgi:hypothetical protein